MKNRKNYVMPSTPTLAQSGLLAVLLQRQRRKAIELTRHRAHREQIREMLGSSLIGSISRLHSITAGRRFRRGFGGETVP